MQWLRLINIVIVPLMVLCPYMFPLSVSADWYTVTVDSDGDIVGSFNSLALDSYNNPHISYQERNYPRRDLKYTYYNSTVWQKIPGDSSTEGHCPSLNLNSDNNPRIIFDTIEYSWCDSMCHNTSNWNIEPLDSIENGSYPYAALDTSGMPHVTYLNTSTGLLEYTYREETAGWMLPHVVDSDSSPGFYKSSLALDSSDRAHISYYDQTNRDLKYATNVTGTWVTHVVDSAGDVGSYTSIGLDSEDKVHISYYDSTNGDLKYATNASGVWVIDRVDSMGTHQGTFFNIISIALDLQDKVHISYYDQTSSDLKYATNASGTWITERVDSTFDGAGVVGYQNGDTSLALDTYNRPHISYYYHYFDGVPNGDLKYAKKCFDMDADCDDTLDNVDNCPDDYNPSQEDTYPPGGNGMGNACDCEGNFNCDANVDANDVTSFLADFGRSIFYNPCTNALPCNGDFNCDSNVDAGDVNTFLQDFGRSQFFNPCPACEVGNWCVY